MYFAATGNLTVVGYRANLVCFESKKRRDMFCENEPTYKAITANEAKSYDQEEICRRYPTCIHDLNNKVVGIVNFTFGGDFNSVSYC